jgi:hypothetical protein
LARSSQMPKCLSLRKQPGIPSSSRCW